MKRVREVSSVSSEWEDSQRWLKTLKVDPSNRLHCLHNTLNNQPHHHPGSSKADPFEGLEDTEHTLTVHCAGGEEKGSAPSASSASPSFFRPAFSVVLHPHYFTIEGLDKHYSYSATTTKRFLQAIEEGLLPTDLMDLQLDVSKHFHEGLLPVEVKDHRVPSSSSPWVRQVLLHPHLETMLNDIPTLFPEVQQSWTQEDHLEFEQRVLVQTQAPLVLNPSMEVAYTQNVLQYNRLKHNIKWAGEDTDPISSHSQNQMSSRDKNNRANPFALLKHIESSRRVAGSSSKPFAVMVHQIINKIIEQQDRPPKMLANATSSNATPNQLSQANSPPIQQALSNRRLRFQGNFGKTFCFLQIFTKGQGGYAGIIRVGISPDTNTNGDTIRFGLGNAIEAERFVAQFKMMFERDGCGTLIFDSHLSPSQAPNVSSAFQSSLNGDPNKKKPVPKTALNPKPNASFFRSQALHAGNNEATTLVTSQIQPPKANLLSKMFPGSKMK